MNLFAYVDNNPINISDPKGLQYNVPDLYPVPQSGIPHDIEREPEEFFSNLPTILYKEITAGVQGATEIMICSVMCSLEEYLWRNNRASHDFMRFYLKLRANG